MHNQNAIDRVRAKLDRIPDSDAVTLDKADVRAILDLWQDAAVEAWWAWDRLSEAKTLPAQASAVNDLANAMSDLASWLPGYEYRTGRLPSDEPEHFETPS